MPIRVIGAVSLYCHLENLLLGQPNKLLDRLLCFGFPRLAGHAISDSSFRGVG